MTAVLAALEYAAHGISVVPLHDPTAGRCSCAKGTGCASSGKHPRLDWKPYQERRADADEIRAWWDRWPTAKLALQARDLELAKPALTLKEQEVIVAKADVALLEQRVRLNPVAGLAAGFSEVATQSRELGTELRNFAHETTGAMSRTFSDQFFNLFTGKKGEDIGKQFGESLVRSFTDILARQLTGSISGLFANALGGVR
jgi:hypothetical protein